MLILSIHITYKTLACYFNFFQKKRGDSYCNDNILMGENNLFNRLVVMDDVSDLADKSDNFANVLTCVYVFHTIYPTRSNWQMILSQRKIFNISWIFTDILIKTLPSYCNRYTYKHMPHRDLCLNRLSFEISNPTKIQCLMIDMKHVNDVGPAKFRTGAENDKDQVCYYNYNKKKRASNRFLAVRKQTSTNVMIFSIVKLIDKSNRQKDVHFTIGDELREFDDVSIQLEPTIRGSSRNNFTGGTGTKQQPQQHNNNRG